MNEEFDSQFNSRTKKLDDSYDDLIASLFVLVTHHSLTQCEASIEPIVTRLNLLCEHGDIEHYPNQRQVLLKMRQLWRTKLFKSQLSSTIH